VLLNQHTWREDVNIILIGAQGSGKGTQSEFLSKTLKLRHVASGDLFRKAFDEKTELGLQAKAYVDRGELVPDEITVAMVLSCIKELDGTAGLLLDGFPRTVAQAQALDTGLQDLGQQIDVVVYLDVPREELFRRLAGRLICRAHQHVYHIHFHPPKVAGVCDLDGSELYQRADDEPEAVQRRLNIFFNQTVQVLSYYREQHKLEVVDGNQRIDQVQAALLEAIRHHIEKRR